MIPKRGDELKKRNLLRRVRRQRLKTVTILPSLITLINGICGFAAILFASRGEAEFTFHALDFSSNYAVAGYLIFIAMVADMLDGRVARMSHATSSFGGQLDSLCDMVSFGVAPAFLVLKVLEGRFIEHITMAGAFSGLLVRFIWLSGGVYVVCAAIRLARFNVENVEDETAHMSFVGLPTPAAAGVLASLMLLYLDILAPGLDRNLVARWIEPAMVYVMPCIAIFCGTLMISRIRYPHLVNHYLRGRRPITHLLWFAAVLGLIWLLRLQSALAVTFCGFALWGFGRWFYFRVILIRVLRRPESEPPVLTVHPAGQ